MSITAVSLLLLGAPLAVVAYAYVGYPLSLLALTRRRLPPVLDPEGEWPLVTITVPVYNEETNIAEVLDALLAQDYPPEKRDILVISDASTDRTEEIAGRYREQGVAVLRLNERRGKTAAENAAETIARGDLTVNTDATV